MFLNDSVTYSVGPFVETQITNYLKLRASAGAQFISFDSGGTVNDSSDTNDYYANILLAHRINANITQTISAGHESELGVNSNSVRLNYVRHTATWNIIATRCFRRSFSTKTVTIQAVFSPSTSSVTAARLDSVTSSRHTSPSARAINTPRSNPTSRCATTNKTASRLTPPTVSKEHDASMKRLIALCTVSAFALLRGHIASAQDSSPLPTIPRAAAVEQPVTSTVMRTNSMSVLDDKKRLGRTISLAFAWSKIAMTNRNTSVSTITGS